MSDGSAEKTKHFTPRNTIFLKEASIRKSMKDILDKLHRYEAYVPLYLRIGLGIALVAMGIDMIRNAQWGQIMTSQGAGPGAWAILGIMIGAALLLGLKHQTAALAAGILIMIDMVMPLITSYGVYGIMGGYDSPIISISLLSIAVSLAVTPETICSIDAWRERKRLERVRP